MSTRVKNLKLKDRVVVLTNAHPNNGDNEIDPELSDLGKD